jgi:hypothetical protein
MNTTPLKEPDLPVVDFFDSKKKTRKIKKLPSKNKKRKLKKQHKNEILKSSVTSENDVSQMNITTQTQETKGMYNLLFI